MGIERCVMISYAHFINMSHHSETLLETVFAFKTPKPVDVRVSQ